MKTYKLLFSLVVLSLVAGLPIMPAQAQWPDNSDELPGIYTEEEILISTLLGFSGFAIAAVLVPRPKPELHIKKKELRAGAEERAAALDRLEAYEGPVVIARGNFFKKQDVGLVDAVGNPSLTLDTRAERKNFEIDEVTEIGDLDSMARRERADRLRQGGLYAGFAVSFFYDAAIADHPIEGSARTLSWAMSGLFGGLAAYSFFLKSKVEREHLFWMEELEWKATPDLSWHQGNVGLGMRVTLRF